MDPTQQEVRSRDPAALPEPGTPGLSSTGRADVHSPKPGTPSPSRKAGGEAEAMRWGFWGCQVRSSLCCSCAPALG